MESPLGFAMEQAVVSWVADSKESKRQERAQIVVALDKEMKNIIFSSDKNESPDSTGFKLPIVLEPRTEYYWTVQVWGDQGDTAISDVNYFETGKRKEGISGEWITVAEDKQNQSPYVRKTFKAAGNIAKARLYIVGLGHYWLEVNGARVGEEFFAPGCTSVEMWNQIYTYDLTKYIQTGDNVLGVLMGNGWSKSRFGASSKFHTGKMIEEYYLKAELRIEYSDGKEEIISTDTTWKYAPSAIVEDGIYEGEIYDANKEIIGWSTTACTDITWDNMIVPKEVKVGRLEDRYSLPIVVKEFVKPVDVITTPKGETIIDMGQNMTGWVRFRVNEPSGTTVKLSHGEILQDDCFYNDNLRKAKAEYSFVSNGEERVVEPHFTFYGFRFVKIEGFTNAINLDDFIGCVVYSDLETTGTFETSDARINRLFENAMWSQKDNFLDVPTDCPQRDERMGWTGDAQMFCKTASYNMDCYAFYNKYVHDLWSEQKRNDGMVGHVVPSFMRGKQFRSSFWWGSCAWGDAAVIIPWTLYEHYGDATILEAQYESMKEWIDWVVRTNLGPTGLWENGFKFGDWLALDGSPDQEDDRYGGTDTTLVASGYLKYSSQLVAKTANVLGKAEDETYYNAISERTKQAIMDRYFETDGTCRNRTQTAHVIALEMQLVNDDMRSKVAEGLVELLKESNMHLTTGFVGTPFLCKVLSEAGYSEEAYQVLFQKDFPSWLYEVDMGATTIWERWNSVLPDGKISGTSMNSLNHYTYGSIARWMYENICGVTLKENAFKSFYVKPEPSNRFTYAKMTYDSAMGRIEVKWDEKNAYIKVPFNTTAYVTLPGQEEQVLETGEYTLAM